MLAYHRQTRSRCTCRHLPPVSCSGCRMAHRMSTSYAVTVRTVHARPIMHLHARSSLRAHDEHSLEEILLATSSSPSVPRTSAESFQRHQLARIIENYFGTIASACQYTPACRIATCPPPSTTASCDVSAATFCPSCSMRCLVSSRSLVHLSCRHSARLGISAVDYLSESCIWLSLDIDDLNVWCRGE
jgi:hypothetical protein